VILREIRLPQNNPSPPTLVNSFSDKSSPILKVLAPIKSHGPELKVDIVSRSVASPLVEKEMMTFGFWKHA